MSSSFEVTGHIAKVWLDFCKEINEPWHQALQKALTMYISFRRSTQDTSEISDRDLEELLDHAMFRQATRSSVVNVKPNYLISILHELIERRNSARGENVQ